MAVPLWCFGGKPWDGGLQGNHLWSCRLVTLHTYIVICKCVCVSVSLWAEAGWQVPELMMMVCWIIDVQMLMNRCRQHEHHRRMRNLYRLASMVTESESWLVYHITTMGAYMVWPESNQWNFVSYVGWSCGLDVWTNAEQKTSVPNRIYWSPKLRYVNNWHLCFSFSPFRHTWPRGYRYLETSRKTPLRCTTISEFMARVCSA